MQEKICDPLQRNQPYKCQQIIFQICWFYKMLQVSLNDDTWIFIFCSKFHPSQIDLSVENSFWFASCDMFIGVWTCISKHVLQLTAGFVIMSHILTWIAYIRQQLVLPSLWYYTYTCLKSTLPVQEITVTQTTEGVWIRVRIAHFIWLNSRL